MEQPIEKLTSENYQAGFLVDEEWMAGITKDPHSESVFIAFILNHTTGEYEAYQPFPDLHQALAALNRIPRKWAFEQISGCGNGQCGNGNCKGGKCAAFKKECCDSPSQ